MVTENMSPVEKHQEEKLDIPPDLTSLTTFSLQRAEVNDLEISSGISPSEIDGLESIKRSLKIQQRPWIVYDQFKSEREPDVKPHDMDFKDTFKYIESIRQQVEPYGLCRIVPPSSWKFPSFFEEDDIWQNYRFSTQVQRVNELKNHGSYRKVTPDSDTREAKRRKLDYKSTDVCAANFCSDECQGLESFCIESGPEFNLIAFKRYADYFHQCYFSKEVEAPYVKSKAAMHQAQREPSEQNIEGEFWRIVEKPTEEIEVLYGTDTISEKLSCDFSVSSNLGQASDSVEGVASNWDLNHLNKLPGSLLSFETLDTSGILAPQLHIGMCFSCLPWTVSEHHLYKLQYLHLGAPRIWYSTPGCDSHKFEVIAKRHFPASGKEHLERIHRSDRQLSPKILKSEGIPVYRCIQRPGEFVLFLPGAYHSGFDCGFSCSVSAVFAPLEWLPHGQLSTELYREKRRKTLISYDKVLLRAADEALKAQWESLLRGNKTPKVLTWKETLGKDRVLAKNSETDFSFISKADMLSTTFFLLAQARIRSETRSREYLSSASMSRKMGEAFNGDGRKLECSVCCYDLYMSAVSCPCNHNRYSCLLHAKHFCSCPWTEKIFHFRYEINELNILAEATEGKLAATRIWFKENLGQALQWDKPNLNQNEPSENPSSAAKDKVTSVKHEASGSKLLSEANGSLEMNDNFNAKTGKTSLNNASNDTSSSSSSDIDLDEYVTSLEKAYKSGAFRPASNSEGESLPSGKDRV
uniref:Uncharacterized protein n=1 Tax=Chenopodium quinoa TaxID=63459 RepID=A0A803LF96_CHEQI